MTEKNAFLFYSQDFLFGTLALPMEDRGKYITLLCYMHSHGRLKEEAIIQLVGETSAELKAKFKIDESGCWYNQRLEAEMKKRERFVRSRRSNGKGGGRPHKAELTGDALLFEMSAQPAKDAPPDAAEVKMCFVTRGLNEQEAEYETLKFLTHYTATGWKTTRGAPIIDWRAAVTNWLIHRKEFSKNKQPKTLTEQWLA